MSAPAVLIATCKLRAGQEEAFNAWLARQSEVVSAFPGYTSSDIVPPTGGGHREWTILLNFQTTDLLNQWQKSKERAGLVAELMPLIEGGNLGEVMREDSAGEQPATNITQVIITKIKPGMETAYRAWTVRMQKAQARYPGYRGMYLQPPSAGSSHWTTLLRYDTQEHLDAWLAAPERAEMLREAQAFIESEELMRLATSFPGWVSMRAEDGASPPGWKLALLVLLGLFPIVMLETRFLSPLMQGLNSPVAMFVANVISVSLTSFITIPLAVRGFGWWLFLKKESPSWTSAAGAGLLIVLFAAEIACLWHLLP